MVALLVVLTVEMKASWLDLSAKLKVVPLAVAMAGLKAAQTVVSTVATKAASMVETSAV